ncbi:hypothetical protein AGMMS50239_21620 [Bacteroidia bacterium]|nr:hypothetical protein AGMMS50239_21620 [Bacteroidia bacterium]
MKRKYFIIIIFLIILFACVRGRKEEKKSQLNLDFEKVENGMPKGWHEIQQDSNYSISLDSVNVKSGKYSITIESKSDSACFQTLLLEIPNYDGKQITLSGYIKTQNVKDGYAGLGMRIDALYGQNGINFDNMQQRGITGTTDWKEYEITLDMNPENTSQIAFGGLLAGKGKIWLDNLKITIDGKDISKAKLYQPFSENAKNDITFDKGSNIVFPELNEQKINDLELLGKMWGFLKYHHPEVGKGKYNWDYELFRILPAFLNAENITERDKTLLDWINKYGKIPVCTICKETPSDAYLKPDFSWVEKSDMNSDLKTKIRKIYKNKNQGKHYYIKMMPGIGNPDFTNENPYSNISYPDAGFRLLALYRYWNMIQYFYPNKYLTDKNWNEVLKEYIPKFVLTETRLDYELTTAQLLGEICDSHAFLTGFNQIESMRGSWVAPVKVQFIENKWVVTDYYLDSKLSKAEKENRTGLKIGDIVTHIDKVPVELIVDSIKKYYPASNEAAQMRDIAMNLLRSNKHTLPVIYISSNQIIQKNISLESPQSLYQYISKKNSTNTKSYHFIGNNIGYVTLKTIKDEDIPNIKKEFMNTKGIIIDIRNYPSAFTPFTLAPYFVSKPVPFVKFTIGNPNNPGEFTFASSLEIPVSDETYKGKLVVIVNENTQSSAEYQSMAFRTGDNTTVIGSQTAGADGNVSKILLPGGLSTFISGIGVYYPDGRQTQRVGIVPDIVVKPTIKGIKEGRDEVLEKAIEIIKSEK